MNKKNILLMAGLLIVAIDIAFVYGRGGGGHGGYSGGGGRGFTGGGRSFSGGHGSGGARSGNFSRGGGASRSNMSRSSNRTGSRQLSHNNGNRHGNYNHGNRGNWNHNHGWNRGGYGYWGGGYGGWGWGAFGLGLYLPLAFATAYGISNGGSQETTVINNYPVQSQEDVDYSSYPESTHPSDKGINVPRVPQDAVYISPEMMNDPKVQKAIAAMKAQQNKLRNSQEDED